MMWTILSPEGAVIYPCLISGLHPSESPDWAWEEGQVAIALETAPDPARHEWNGSEWVESLAMAKARLWSAVKLLRDQHESDGADTPLGRMDSDPDSQRKISGLVTMAMLAMQSGQSFAQPFTMADNSVVVHDAAQMIAAGVAVGSHVSAVYAVARDLRERIAAASTIADLQAIDINAGWP